MASQTWPGGLPQDILQGTYTEQPPDVVVRTEMSAGPAKVRRRATAGVRPVSGRIRVTKSEVATFDTFFDSTLKGGALRFDWKNPRTGTSKELRFTGRPEYAALSDDLFEITLPLEILP